MEKWKNFVTFRMKQGNIMKNGRMEKWRSGRMANGRNVETRREKRKNGRIFCDISNDARKYNEMYIYI